MRIVSERQIKIKVKKILDNYSKHLYYYMPVPGGYGTSTVDYLGFCCGRGFAVETKRTDGKLTPRQDVIVARIRVGGAAVFIIRDDASLAEFNDWCYATIEKFCNGPNL